MLTPKSVTLDTQPQLTHGVAVQLFKAGDLVINENPMPWVFCPENVPLPWSGFKPLNPRRYSSCAKFKY